MLPTSARPMVAVVACEKREERVSRWFLVLWFAVLKTERRTIDAAIGIRFAKLEQRGSRK